MKKYTVYVCEVCGYESTSFDDISEHEAEHLGLTVEEWHRYEKLKSFVQYMEEIIAGNNNDLTRNKLSEATENLLTFKKEHGMDAKLYLKQHIFEASGYDLRP